MPLDPRLFRPAAVALVVAAVPLLWFYAWTATSGRPFNFGEPHDGLYDLQARAFAHGQLHLEVAPRTELFETSEPYEPGRNSSFRLHDASLYHGRYYLYFGVVPVLLAFLPWRLAGLGDLPEAAAAVGFAFFCFVFLALALRRLVVDHLPGLSTARLAVLFLALGLLDVAPFVLRRPDVYEVAIAAGACFLAAAAWAFLSAAGTSSLVPLALGGLLTGLAVGSRANLLFAAPLLPLLAWSPRRPWRSRAGVAAALAAAVPFGLCLLALGAYNRARFASWTEFGAHYQLMGGRPVPWFDFRAVPPTLFMQFLAPPSVRGDLPFLVPFYDWTAPLPEGYFLDPRTTGVLAHSPFLLILLAAPFLLRGEAAAQAPLLRRRLLVLTAAGLTLPLVSSFAFGSAAMRFQLDFVPLLLVPALVLWLVLGRRARPPWASRVRLAGAAVFGWSLVAALALSLHGASDDLRRENPALFASLSARIEPLRVLVARVVDPDDRAVVRLRVAFPEELSAESEPLLSWGTVDAFDVLRVRRPAPGVFALSLDTMAGRGVAAGAEAGPSVRVEPGRFYDVVVELDRAARRVRATIGAAAALELAGRLVPVNRNRIWPGRGPRGHGAPVVGRFSGSFVTAAMMAAGPPGLERLPPVASAPAVLVGDRSSLPAAAGAGQLALVEGRAGAWEFTGRSWRWTARAFVDRVRLDRPFTPPPAGAVLPLLVSGEGEEAEAVVAQGLGADRAAFGLARWDGAWSIRGRGAEARPTCAEPTVSVTLDRPGRSVAATLCGREVLRVATELRPLAVESLRGAREPAGPVVPAEASGDALGAGAAP